MDPTAAQVRYEICESVGSLPIYNAVWVRRTSKSGDMKLCDGGTPYNLRYKGKRGSPGELIPASLFFEHGGGHPKLFHSFHCFHCKAQLTEIDTCLDSSQQQDVSIVPI